MIENDPTVPEAELLETLKVNNCKYWTASENQKLLEAYEIWGLDYNAISTHVGTKSTEQVHTKLLNLQSNMKNNPAMPMSHFLYTDPKVRREKVKWTESENLRFNDAVRKVGNNANQISSIIGSKTYRQVQGRINQIR